MAFRQRWRFYHLHRSGVTSETSIYIFAAGSSGCRCASRSQSLAQFLDRRRDNPVPVEAEDALLRSGQRVRSSEP
jgi:hypothetical protein